MKLKQDEFIREFNEFYNKNYSEILDYKLFRFINHLLEKQKPREINWQWVEDEHFKWYKSKTMVTPQAHLLFLKDLLKHKSLPQPLSEVSDTEIENLYRNELINGDVIPNWKDGFKKALSMYSLPPDSKENEAVRFAEWINKTHTSVAGSIDVKWVKNDIEVLCHGSLKYYDKLIFEHGKTTQELFTLYKEGGEK